MMFDITIIGGGHAGVEAAYIASQFKELNIAIITTPGIGLASAPCNPSVGGVGKGQVVREIDALGGIMGQLADFAGIQFRTLNESKGYAVQSTRVQIDKVEYSKKAEAILSSINNITIIREAVSSLKEEEDYFILETECSTWNSRKVIFTVGTFLNGKMHTGEVQTSGGRLGCKASPTLSNFFENIKTVSKRFKTGTPARLNHESIEYSKLEEQPSDGKVETFHVLHGTNQRFMDQKSCYLAYTNEKTMSIIRENKEKSPMFNGQINAVGARYCPSIEDKAYRYPDKNIHHVFVEPESHSLNTVYPSGISTSLPKDVQEQMISSIKGLESAKIEIYGYAVEYDVLDTTQLSRSLELIDKPGVYFAGQVNGTSGYEEAAGQGLIAGINAALSLRGKDPLILDRKESYIGVMVEDLVSNTRDEPYRLFTARSENRLFIREDNTTLRMANYRKYLDLNMEIDKYNDFFVQNFEVYKEWLEEIYINPNSDLLRNANIEVPRRTSLADIVRQAKNREVERLNLIFSELNIKCDTRLQKALAITIKYDGYINKANIQSIRVNRLDSKKLSIENLLSSENISFECKQRIKLIKPETFGQLKLIEGIRPATLAVVASSLS